MRLIWQNLFISCFFWWSVAASYVYIDFSKDQCVGCTSQLGEHYVVGDNNTHCLRSCILQRTKYAVYKPGRDCFCTNNTLNHEDSDTCCIRSVVNDSFKVYKLNGIVVQVTLSKFIEQSKSVFFKPQILLRNTSELDGNRTGILEKLSAGYNCTFSIHSIDVLQRRPKVSDTACNAFFKLDNLGENIVCVGFRDSEERGCGIVEVLAPIKNLIVDLPQSGIDDRFPTETKFNVRMSGSVFKLSYAFGDGNNETKWFTRPDIYRSCGISLQIGHNYTSPGKYNFTICASNPLNESKYFYHIEQKLTLSITIRGVVKNKNKFTVFLKAKHKPVETKLKYIWKVEWCQRRPASHARFKQNITFVPNVTLTMPWWGMCIINVISYNEYGISVGKKNKRLSFTPSDNSEYVVEHRRYVLKDTVSIFRAGLENVLHYWLINDTKVPGNWTLSHKFTNVGSYVVSSKHDKFIVIVRDRISNVTFNASLSSIMGLSVIFKANVVPMPDDVTFEWYFGDGEKHPMSSSGTTKHNYEKPGVYQVKLVVGNNVSAADFSRNVTVTALCPKFEVETSFQNYSQVKVHRNLPIHLEVGMKHLDCVEPVTLKYVWKMSTKISKWIDVDLDNQDVNKTSFGIYIPSNTLKYQKYRFQVKVFVTLVSDRKTKYSEEYSTFYEIIRTPLQAIIRGGFIRYVSKQTKSITMDASMSFDPDNPGSDIQFTWTCSSTKVNSSCFKSGYSFKTSYSIIRDIPFSAFINGCSLFVFNVNIKNKQFRGSTIQIVSIKDGDFDNILLDCPSCNEGILNPEKPVVILPKCTKCTNKEKISWTIYQNGDSSSVYFNERHCTKWKSDFGLGIAEKTFLDHKYVPCVRNTSDILFDEEKDYICSVFYEKLCKQSSEERLLLPRHEHSMLDNEIFEIKKSILPSERFLMIESKINDTVIVARRYFFVQRSPRETACRVKPETGLELHENFRLTCVSRNDESRFLIYKIVFKREDEVGRNHRKRPDFIFQRSLRSLTFQLPSGSSNTVKYSLKLSIVNEHGVAREYCAMKLNVSPFNPGPNITIEEFLYNRSVTAKEMFHGHKYAYHAQSLHNITIIAEVLNRQPQICKHTSKFHLRTQTRMLLVEILNRIDIHKSEYATSQFADSLESCTRVPEELNNATTVSAINTLKRVFAVERREKYLVLEERYTTSDDYWMHSVVDVADKLLMKTHELGENQHNKDLVQSLECILQDKLKSMRMAERFTLEKSSFNATLLKVFIDDNITIPLTCGDAHLMLPLKGPEIVTKHYFCDIYGYGVQAVILNTNPFGQNDVSYHQISPMAKLTTYDCQGNEDDLIDDVSEVRIKLPIETFMQNPTVNHNITPSESHRFVLDGSVNDVLEIEFSPVSLMSPKLKLTLKLSCTDPMESFNYYSGNVTYNNPLRKGFPREMIENCNGNLSIVINTYWLVPPGRVEQVNTVVNYTMMIKRTACLSWDSDAEEWSENHCKVKGVPSHYLTCSCSKIKQGILAVTRMPKYNFEKTPIPRETNTVMRTVVLVLSAIYVIALIILYVFEKQEQVRQRSFIVLTPCDESHTHEYQVTVYTGYAFGAGTTAKVGLKLYGENNSSYPVELSIENYSLFRRHSRDNFIVSVREKLGPLTKIYLWHDNSGSFPSWFVEKIIIKDLKSQDKWMFECCRWLAVDKDDKKLDCKIKPCDGKPRFTYQEFKFEFGKKMMDINLWLSLMGMPLHSLFRRTERLTCCFLVVFGHLFFNAFFYQNRNDARTMYCISAFNPMWAQFEIGVLSAFVVIPVYLLFSIMFRFIKPTEAREVAATPRQSEFGEGANAGVTNVLSLERCASVLRDLGHRSHTKRNKVDVAPQQAAFRNSEISPEVCSNNSTVFTMGSSTDVSVVNRIIDHEITSQGSGSYMRYENTEKFRFPGCFSVLMWIGCITTSVLAACFTVEYTHRFDRSTLVCYIQSVCWSLFLSFFVCQPFQALLVTLAGMLHRKYKYHDAYIDDPVEDTERGGRALRISDRMDLVTGTTEQYSEEAACQKALYLKYLQPISKRELRRAWVSQRKRNQTLATVRDLLLYLFVLVLLYLMTSYTNQQTMFLHNQRLKNILTRQANTNSFRMWWSSGPQRVLDTLEYDKFSGLLTALGGRPIIGNPKVVVTNKYCENVSKDETSYLPWNCSTHERHITISFNKSQKNNWEELSDDVHNLLIQHVKAISLDFVIYSPASNMFSVVKWTAEELLASSLRSDVAIKTFCFCVDGSTGISVYTIYQLLFTVVPILLILRHLHSYVPMKNICINIHLQVLELSIVILAVFSSTVMWMWIKNQYSALALLRHMSFQADLMASAEMIYIYQKRLRTTLGFLQFLVFLKVCHVVGFGKLLESYGFPFIKTLGLVLVPLFSLAVVLTAFAHTGMLLFGSYLESFSTLAKALSLDIIYLKEIGTANLFLENRDENVLIVLYVIAFCVCVGFVSCLIKAAFCRAHFYNMLSAKDDKFSLETIIYKVAKRSLSLVKPYINLYAKKEQENKSIAPLRYVVKEINERLDKLQFRLVNLLAIENMPPKSVASDESSSWQCNDEDVQYVYKMGDDVTSDDSDSSATDSFAVPLECSSVERSDEGTSDNDYSENNSITPLTRDEHEALERTSNGKPEIDTAILIRSRPFERATPVFPKPISMRMNLAGRPIVPLHALTEETLRPNVNVDNNSESETILMSKYAAEDKNPAPADFSRKFRSPVFPVSIDTLLSHSSRIENTDTKFDYSKLD